MVKPFRVLDVLISEAIEASSHNESRRQAAEIQFSAWCGIAGDIFGLKQAS